MQSNVFAQKDYKSVLKNSLLDHKLSGKTGLLTRFALACNIQKAYLSKVLNHDAHLNSDQIYLAAEFLGLSPKQFEFLKLLHEMDRSSVPKRREELLKQINKLRLQAKNTENYISATPMKMESNKLRKYYLNPTLQIIHLYLTIPRYAVNVSLLEKILFLTTDELEEHLRTLIHLKIARLEKGKWIVVQDSIHLPRNSEIYPAYRVLLRNKAIEKLQSRNNQNDYSFSVILSCDEEIRHLIQEKFMSFLKSIEAPVEKSAASRVYQINFDLLEW